MTVDKHINRENGPLPISKEAVAALPQYLIPLTNGQASSACSLFSAPIVQTLKCRTDFRSPPYKVALKVAEPAAGNRAAFRAEPER